MNDGISRAAIELCAKRFAADEEWNWDSLHETDDTEFGWGREHIRRRFLGSIDELVKFKNDVHAAFEQALRGA